MDSLTQISLGALVGEICLGKKAGNRAILWGMIAGTLPDLDILVCPLLDQVGRIAFHRGMSHSLVFLTLLAPVLGFLIHKFYRKKLPGTTVNDWSWLFFWALVTHPLLDIFTTYGTQFFWPFSDIRLAVCSIFIADPVFTGPLVLAILVIIWISKHNIWRNRLARVALTFSTLYLGWTVISQSVAKNHFNTSLAEQGIQVERLHTTPTPLNSILWYGVAEADKGFYIGLYSHFDKRKNIEFQFYPQNEEILQEVKDTRIVKVLRWFSNEYFIVRREKGAVRFHDLRFGKLSGLETQKEDFVFSFRIVPLEKNYRLEEIRPDKFDLSLGEYIHMLINRIKGV